MKILVLNSGSSSIKFQLFLMQNEESIASGIIEQIGAEKSRAVLKANGKVYEKFLPIQDHHEGLEVMNELFRESNTLHDLSELDGIGHRIVHGGENFFSSMLVNDEVIKKIEETSPLAPLHNPGHIAGIKNAMQSSKNVPHVVVFDTVFHQSMPEYAYRYALPYEICKEHHIRKYGFHGTSHNYVCKRAATLMGIDHDKFNAISLHLGNGASVCAVQNGKSVDTSMGLSPLEGLIMGTRSGDIDPAALVYLLNANVLKWDEIDTFLNKKSGLFGICGSSDMRDVVAKMQSDERAKLAFDMFCYRVKKYIGAYYAVLGRVDAIIFTGGIGENAPNTRQKICDDLKILGIHINHDLNFDTSNSSERCLDEDDARTKVFVIPTNEELEIARETKKIIENRGK
ncbi:acetate kinase [Campylobacter sp. RM9344]|uniref:Acetate kinase n=1 Tax=Campylobacter californiensis TaxID=1032243 RepID=A0AAW3ZTX3_9BACT|nr:MULTISPECIES: acetate kinase [unclassified Campylobacter]MBE2984346.1 acetate kinase [Campylobacter sp. RM6883]MBE2985900.1 acetate kinase [Campylobacter sp. RM12919]MBE2988101.1 acetate kinase [Campylobacter sp. RM12920]MBE2994787.1 acetate kinase [Campylobacter sp. RM6913]MBE3021441.1 acetate kinase [Campylobacter sp. 7477a]MBE3030138.1 acetate kinase [Campylobacter sp. RM9344]